jgi:RNA polymerase sigma factor (sigma-70 family)
MASNVFRAAIHRLRRTVSETSPTEVSDADLLKRFIESSDQAAFELLLWRHERMVFGVCQRTLGSWHDAEDAFQATFLALARKAASISRRQSVASWLYKVAYRVAARLRVRTSRHAALARKAAGLAHVVATHDAAPIVEAAIRPIIDKVLNQLPEKYKAPIVLCYFEGKTYAEAARLLGCPRGTLSIRLTRARLLLKNRLANEGLTLSTGLLVAALSEQVGAAAVASSRLIEATSKGAALLAAGKSIAEAAPVPVAALTQGVLRAMVVTKIKTALMLLLVSGTLGLAGVALAQHLGTKPVPPEEKATIDASIRKAIDELESPRFAVREAAADRLKKIGTPALPALRQAAQRRGELEPKRRAEDLIAGILDATIDRHVKEAAKQDEAIKQEYKKSAEILRRVAELAEQRLHPDGARGPVRGSPFLLDIYLRLGLACKNCGEKLDSFDALEKAEQYCSPADYKTRERIRKESRGVVLSVLPRWEKAVRKNVEADPALKALCGKYPIVLLLSRRYDGAGDYFHCCYSFIDETTDNDKCRNGVHLQFDNGGGDRTFHVNMVTNQRNTVVDLGKVDFKVDPNLANAPNYAEETGTQRHLAIDGHVYLEKVEDTNGNRFFVLFKVLAVDPESRYMAFIWRQLPGGRVVRR